MKLTEARHRPNAWVEPVFLKVNGGNSFNTNTAAAAWVLPRSLYLASVQAFSELGEGGQSSESESDSPAAMYGRMVAQGVVAPLWWSPRLVEDKQKLFLRKSRFSLD